MTELMELFEPQNTSEAEVFAIEDLVFQVQVEIQRLMKARGIGHRELADRLSISPARVSQIFSKSGPNLTLKTIARILHVLGENAEFRVGRISSGHSRTVKSVERHRVKRIATAAVASKTWKHDPANDNYAPKPVAA